MNGIPDDPVQAMLDDVSLSATLFGPASRYYGLGTAAIDVDGRSVRYVLRRFVPQPESFTVLQQHTVTEGERPDIIAARYLGDPTAFWRLCDANRALDPGELTATTGRKLRITLPGEADGTRP